MSSRQEHDTTTTQERRPNGLVATDGSFRFPIMLLLAVMIPLVWSGRWMWAMTAVLACLLMALCNAMMEGMDQQDKLEIRYNNMSPPDILSELQQWKQQQQGDKQQEGEQQQQQGELMVLTGLLTLAKKYGRQSALVKSAGSNQERDTQEEQHLQEFALIGQEASYLGLGCFPQTDAVVAAALSLLALVAKQDVVRQRHYQQADVYGLDVPIQCMQKALHRAKNISDENNELLTPNTTTSYSDNLTAEQQAAELQRKGCLFLGALADGDATMARLVAQEGGIEAILQAVDWYRYHSDVANWALWAIFILSSEVMSNKAIFVECNGLPIVICALRNCTDTIEVVRHGFAVLFDLMREQEIDGSSPRLDVWRIRNTAMNEGIHQVIVRAMEEYSEAADIIMMGQAILVGTDYNGDIPQYQPAK